METFTYTPPNAAPLRFTVRTASVLDWTHYLAYRKDAVEEFKTNTGVTPWEAEGISGDAWIFLEVGFVRAYLLACTVTYEQQVGDGWQAWPTPKSWETCRGFVESLDVELYGQWQKVVLRWNPTIFSTDESDEGKVDGGDNATA